MNTVTFETYDVGVKQLLPGETYIFRSWGWNSRELELVKNNTISWLREKFKPTDALEFRDENGYLSIRKLEEGEVPTEGQIIPDGWEHEHCALCWQTISCLETDENFAYTDGNDWICETCYEKYIASGFGKRLG